MNTVTSPLYFSSAKLYTHDFLEQIRQRLESDGVYMTWADSRVGDKGMEIILSTLSRSFKYCALGTIKTTYYLLLCSEEPLHVHHPDIVSRHPILSKSYRRHLIRAAA